MRELNIGDFISILYWFDFQGINWRMKKIHKTFNDFAEKILDDHVNVNHLMSVASNGRNEAEANPDVEDFVDVLLHMAETDKNITRERIKALVLVCSQATFHSILFKTLFLNFSQLLQFCINWICICAGHVRGWDGDDINMFAAGMGNE